MKKILALISLGVLMAPGLAYAAFDTDLRYASRGQEVSALQEFLTDHGFYSGPVTGNFYSLTLAGVKRFQSAYQISSTGYFGPLSRAVANALLEIDLADSDVEASTTPIVNTDPITAINTQITQLQNQLTQIQNNTTPVVPTPAPTPIPAPTGGEPVAPADTTPPVILSSGFITATGNSHDGIFRIFTNEPIDIPSTKIYWAEWGADTGISYDPALGTAPICTPSPAYIDCRKYVYEIPSTYSIVAENIPVGGKYRSDFTVNANLVTPPGDTFLPHSAQMWIFDQAGNHSIVGLGSYEGLQ